MNFFIAAFSLGFLGSLHCVGMCGPIALTLPVNRSSSIKALAGSLVYNSGRVITYTFMGLVFGLLGQGFVLAGGQRILSIGLGISILVMYFAPKRALPGSMAGLILRFTENLKSPMRKLFGINSTASLFMIGLMNGLLPCGLVYLGLAGSVAAGNALGGGLFMTAFGLGTIPAMLAISAVRDKISLDFRGKIRKVIPLFVGMMALMLILRGLNLDILHISCSRP
jgi:sulfite exporter TauE/SafE